MKADLGDQFVRFIENPGTRGGGSGMPRAGPADTRPGSSSTTVAPPSTPGGMTPRVDARRSRQLGGVGALRPRAVGGVLGLESEAESWGICSDPDVGSPGGGDPRVGDPLMAATPPPPPLLPTPAGEIDRAR